MAKEFDYNILRSILDRWYAGLSTPEEELTLRNWAKDSRSIPDEFAVDKALLLSLDEDASSVVTDLPEGYADRIESAMAAEFAGSCTGRMSGLRSHRRRVISGWCTAAACAAVVFACVWDWVRSPEPASDPSSVSMVVAMEDAPSSATPGNMMDRQDTAIASGSLTTMTMALNSTPRKATGATRCKAHDPEEYTDQKPTPSHSHHLSERYRVVESEEEALAIINSILSDMDMTVSMESDKISRAKLEYDFEMTKLNVVGTLSALGEYYRENEEPI